MRRFLFLLLPSLAFFVLPGRAQQTPAPAELQFLSAVSPITQHDPYRSYDESTFPQYGANQVKKRGHRWDLIVEIRGQEQNMGAWNAVKPLFLKNGWTVVSENPNGGLLVVLSYAKNGTEIWVNASFDGVPPLMRCDVVQVVPPPISHRLAEPSPTPEKLTAPDKGDFPYLTPLPGSVAQSGAEDPSPFRLTPKGASQDEIVASGSYVRNYQLKDLSQFLFAAVYHDALLKAGWSIEQETPNGEVIIAHYTRKGRDIWAYLVDHDDLYTITVGKEAAPDQMKSALASTCHVALYGVLFDFNKATLQPASDGILTQVATLLTANPALNVEVQGHTDNAGADAYNQTLSEARARSVMTWLTQHGIAARRMTAKGYGRTQPVADNDTEEGRQKNRRVEIADPKCKP